MKMRLSARQCVAAVAISATMTFPSSASAVDGVIEINQVSALAGGVTAGDAPGFPVTLSVSGSYRLTSNLTPPASTVAIEVTADDSTVDLNGFTLTGSGSGFTNGVEISAATNVEIRSGTVRSFPSSGIYASQCTACRVVDMRLHDNGWAGSLLTGSMGSYRGCVAWGNGNAGLYAQSGGSFVSNVSYNNGFNGIYLSGSGGGLIAGNVAWGNAANGIATIGGANVRANASYANLGYQLSLSGSTAYSDNALSSSGSGSVLGGINMGGNLCGIVVCP